MPKWTKCPRGLTLTTHSSGERVERKFSVLIPVILLGPKRRTAPIAGLLPLGLRLVRVSRRLLLLLLLLLLFVLRSRCVWYANILMSLPETAPAAAAFPDYTPAPVPDVPSDAADVTPAGTHIEEID